MTYNARIKNIRNNAITITGSQLVVTGSIVSSENITASVNLSASSIFANNITASTVSASTYWGLPTGVPGGPQNSIQFNSGSTLTGSSDLVFDYNTNTLSGTKAEFTNISSVQLSSSVITASEINTDYIDFNTGLAANPSFQTGRVYYDINSKDLQFNTEIATVSINLGQQLVIKAKNNTTGSIAKGKLVRVDGGIGTNPTIALASWDNDNNSANTLGMVMQTVAANDTTFVLLTGVITGISLNPAIYTAGDLLYLSSSGDYTNIKPVAPKHTVKVAEVVRAHATEGAAFIKVDNGYEIDELHNVLAVSASSGDLLVYDSGLQLWENKKQLTGSYGLTGSLTVTGTVSGSTAQYTAVTGSTVTGSTAQFTTISGSIISGSQLTGNLNALTTNVSIVSGSTTLGANSHVILASASVADLTLTLPTAASSAFRQYVIKKIDNTVFKINISGSGGETLDGASGSFIGTQYESLTVVSDGNNKWFII